MRICTYIGMFSQINKNIQSFCTTYLRKENPLQVLKICPMILPMMTPKTYIPTCPHTAMMKIRPKHGPKLRETAIF